MDTGEENTFFRVGWGIVEAKAEKRVKRISYVKETVTLGMAFDHSVCKVAQVKIVVKVEVIVAERVQKSITAKKLQKKWWINI